MMGEGGLADKLAVFSGSHTAVPVCLNFVREKCTVLLNGCSRLSLWLGVTLGHAVLHGEGESDLEEPVITGRAHRQGM